MGEHEQEGAPSTGATRSQHVVLQGPPDSRMLMAAMRAAVERSRGAQGVAAPACLVITPTPEQALVAAEQARRLLADEGTRVVPVTAVARARRVLAAPVGVVTGTVETLLALRRAAALSLEGLRGVVIGGLDAVLAAGAEESLVALLADWRRRRRPRPLWMRSCGAPGASRPRRPHPNRWRWCRTWR